jgi:membrane-associated phospholipid phosphatase
MWMANAISMSSVAGVLVPFGVWTWTADLRYAGLAVAVILASATVEWIKRVVVAAGAGPWSRRPAGARDCDMWCAGGPVGGAPGFPSGHMSTTTLLVTGMWFLTKAPAVLWIGVPWIGAMAWARWVKRCHSVVQIVGGALVGVGAAIGLKSVGLL